MEMCVLASVLIGGGKASQWFERNVPVSAFYRPAHRTIAKAVCEMVREGIEVDLATLKARLMFSGVLADIGGEEYIVQIFDHLPSASNLRHYANVMLGLAARREIVERCKSVIREAEADDTDLDEIQERAFRIGRDLPLLGTDTVSAADFDLVNEDPAAQGIKTPWPSLDYMTDGGWYRREMAMIVAKRGTGKTAIMVDSAIKAHQAGFKPAYATFEMGGKDILKRCLQNLCGFSKRPKVDGWVPMFLSTVEDVERMAMPIYDPTARRGGNRSVESLCSWAEDLHSSQGFDVLFVDYAQKLSSKRKAENRTREMDFAADELHDLAKRLNIAIVVGSQKTNDLHDKNEWRTKDSIKWEDNAGLVLHVKREENSDAATIVVAKNRHGAPGEFDSTWNKRRVRYEEEEVDPYAEP
jgi:replicative DNA helicase